MEYTIEGKPVYRYEEPDYPPGKLEHAVADSLNLEMEFDGTRQMYHFKDPQTGKAYAVPALDGYNHKFILDTFKKLKNEVIQDRQNKNDSGSEKPVSSLDDFMKISDARVFTKEQIETLKVSLSNLKKRLDLAADAVRTSDERTRDAEVLVEEYRILAEEKVKANEKLLKQIQSLESLLAEQTETIKTLTEQIIEMQG